MSKALLKGSPACKEGILDDSGCDNIFTISEATCLKKSVRLTCENGIDLGKYITVSQTLVILVLRK